MPSIHVGHAMLILQIIKKQVFLGMLTQNAEERRFTLHPVKLLNKGVMRDCLDWDEMASTYIKDFDFFGDG